MNKQILAENNIKNLLLKLSIPAMTGMMVMALYNIVDTIFVGKAVGTLGIAGLSIAFPIQMVVLALGQMFGIGSASIISRALGEQKIEKANRVVGTIFLFGFIIAILIIVFGSIFIDKLLTLFGSAGDVSGYAKSYLKIIIVGTAFPIFSMTGNNIVRSEGQAKIAMFTLVISSVLNIILDFIFIIILKLGVSGAAYATIISQAFGAVFLFTFLQSGKSTLHFNIKNFILDFKLLKEIISIGTSSFARHFAASLLFIVINNQLKIYSGAIGLAVFGIVFRFSKFIFLPVMGIGQGFQPIVGYNYGAKRLDKVLEVTKLAIASSFIIFLLGFGIVQIFPRFLIQIFSNDPEVINLGARAIRIMIAVLPLVAIQVIGGIMFQALGKALPALILSMAREIFILLPLLVVLPRYFQADGIWLSYPIADILGCFITTTLFVRLILRLRKELNSNLTSQIISLD